MKSLEEIQQIVKNQLASINWISNPISLYEPIAYSMSMGGKYLRSCMTLIACNMYKNDISEAIQPAIGIEVFHNFTLLHDDIMDKAITRRGKETVHIKWNENAAILSGDAMHIKAYQFVAKCPEKNLPEILSLFSKTAIEVCEGQQYDMDFETRENVTEEEYIQMITLKTAVLVAASLQIGAIIGGASREQANNLYQFGIHIGIAFQLQDDYLDVFGDPAVFGKKIGGDISCNKKTFLLIQALKNATPNDAKNLHYWLENNNDDTEKKISEVTQIYKNSGADLICRERMELHLKMALSYLKMACETEKNTLLLEKMAIELMNRQK